MTGIYLAQCVVFTYLGLRHSTTFRPVSFVSISPMGPQIIRLRNYDHFQVDVKDVAALLSVPLFFRGFISFSETTAAWREFMPTVRKVGGGLVLKGKTKKKKKRKKAGCFSPNVFSWVFNLTLRIMNIFQERKSVGTEDRALWCNHNINGNIYIRQDVANVWKITDKIM